MEFNQLESFLSVVKHKSFSKAAKELYRTQPTISNNISALEKELKVTLLDRKNKTITLTDSGRRFYKYAVELVNIREDAKFDILKHENKLEGNIEIRASSIPAQYILPYIIKDFTKIYPDISFSVISKDSQTITDEILNDESAFGIVGSKNSSAKLKYTDFYKDELVLAVPKSKDYPSPDGKYLDIDIVLSNRFILRKEGSGTRDLIEKCLALKDISLDDLEISFSTDNNEMIKTMIELELGVSFLSEISIRNEVELGLIKTFKIKDLELKRSFYFVCKKNVTLHPIVEVFKNFLAEWKAI